MKLWHERWLRLSTAALLIIAVSFGALTLARSAFQQVKKTDLTVYLRAAWAARTGENLYSVTDEHGWHYHYPPLIATLLVPFAQPPADSGESALVPFATVVVVWYCIGIGCVFAAVSMMSSAVGSAAVFRAGKYRFWLLHAPVWMLLPALGSSLGRGQINEIVLLLLAATIVAAVHGQRFMAGAWLAIAICIKVIPLYLLIYPLWKRDTKWLAGTAVGLIAGLFVVPTAMIGPSRTVAAYGHWVNQFVHPALIDDDTSDRGKELIGMTSTDNQSIQNALHNIGNLDRATRPRIASPLSRISHWLIGAILTVVTLVAASRSQLKEPHREALSLGALTVPMLLVSPMCHLHYFVLLLPLTMALVGSHLAFGQRVRPALLAVIIINFFTGLIPRIPGCEVARDVGLASFGALLLWAAAIIELGGEAVIKMKFPGRNYVREIRRRWAISHTAGAKTRNMPRQSHTLNS